MLAAIISDALQENSFTLAAKLLDEDCTFVCEMLAQSGRLDDTYWVCAFAVNQHICICHSNPYDRDPLTNELHPVCSCSSVNLVDPDGRSTASEVNKFDDMMHHLVETGGCRQVIAVDQSHDLFRGLDASYLPAVTLNSEPDETDSWMGIKCGFFFEDITLTFEAAVVGHIGGYHAEDSHASFHFVAWGFCEGGVIPVFVCKLCRLLGYAGQRVGEASHPGPDLGDGQLAMLISLVQLLIQMVAKLSNASEIQSIVAQADATVQGLSASTQGGAENARQVRVEEPEGEWTQVRKKKRGKGKGDDTAQSAPLADVAPRNGKKGGKEKPEKVGKARPCDAANGPRSEGKKGQGKGEGVGERRAFERPELKHDEWELRQEDWHATLVTSEQLEDYNKAGESLLVLAKNREEAEVLQILASGRSFKSSLLVVYRHDEGSLSMPFWQKGRAALHRVEILKFQVNGVALATLKGEKKVVSIKAVPTTVLRLALIQQLASAADWAAATKNLRSFAMTRAAAVKDLWGGAVEQKRGATLVALVRVPDDQVQALLQKSGVGGLFWEPLQRSVAGVNLGVRWIDANEGENEVDYFQRCLLMKPAWGLVAGRKQIGIRVDRSTELVIRSWRLPNLPHEWTQDDVMKVVQEAGLEQVTVTGRLTRKGTATWFVRGAASLDVLAIPVEQGSPPKQTLYYLLPATPSPRGPSARQPLPRQTPVVVETNQFKVVQKPLAGEQETGEGRPEGDVKRQAIGLREVPDGTKLIQIQRDGNCLPGCVAQAVAWHKNASRPMPTSRMRAEVVAYMRRKQAHFAPFWDKRDTNDVEGGVPDFESYLKEAAMEGKYWGHLEIMAAADLFSLAVYIIPAEASLTPTKVGTGNFPVALSFERGTGKIGHYDLLVPALDGGPLPAVITNIQEIGDTKGGRGGGVRDHPNDTAEGSDAAWTVYTRNAEGVHVPVGRVSGAVVPPPAPVRPSASTAGGGSSRKGAPSAATGGAASCSLVAAFARGARRCELSRDSSRCSNDAEDDVAVLADVEGIETEPAEPTRRKKSKIWEWTCPVPDCGFTCGGSFWSFRKNKHIRAWHPERMKELNLRGVIDEPIEVRDDAVVTWRCPVCLKAFPAEWNLTGDKLRQWKLAHGARAHPEENIAIFKRRTARPCNAPKATQAVRAKGVSSRLSQIKRGIGGHSGLFTIDVPATQPGRRSAAYFVCRHCKCLAHTAKLLAKMPCEAVVGMSQQRQALIQRLAKQKEDATLDERLRSGAAELVNFLTAGAGEGEASKQHIARDHELEAIPWPMEDKSFAVRFVCVACCRLAGNERGFPKGTCKGEKAFAKYRQRWLRELEPWLKDDGPRGRAARQAKSKLGILDEPSPPELPRGLVGGGEERAA